jgi:hypothetical protein
MKRIISKKMCSIALVLTIALSMFALQASAETTIVVPSVNGLAIVNDLHPTSSISVNCSPSTGAYVNMANILGLLNGTTYLLASQMFPYQVSVPDMVYYCNLTPFSSYSVRASGLTGNLYIYIDKY